MDAPLYLHDILQTINTETTRIKQLEMQFNIVSQPTFTDDDGLSHLNLADPPLIFSHGLWTDIGRMFSDLSYSGCTEFAMSIYCHGPEASAVYKHIVSPTAEGSTLCAVIFRWLDKFLVPDAVFNPAADFSVQVSPD